MTRANLETNAAAAEAVRIASAAATGAAVHIISHDSSVDGAGDSGGAAATVAPAAASRNAHDHSGKPKAAGDATPSAKKVHLDDISDLLEQQRELTARIAKSRRGDTMDHEVR